MKPVRTWFLIADAASAKVFENTGPGHGLKELSGKGLTAPAKPEFDDRQGRTFNSVGAGRHKHEPHFSVDHSFADLLAKMLLEEDRQGSFDRIVLCAAPDTLGALRAQIPKSVEEKVHAEVPKNLMKIPQIELPDHFEDIVAL